MADGARLPKDLQPAIIVKSGTFKTDWAGAIIFEIATAVATRPIGGSLKENQEA
jgi:hypothetical protein